MKSERSTMAGAIDCGYLPVITDKEGFMSNAAAVVEGFKNALGKGDVAAARKLLHDHLSFHGPLDTFDSPEPYLEALAKLSHIVKRIDVKKLFVDGKDVCMLYEMVTNSPAGTAFVAEWFHIEGGKIAVIHAVFDARPFAAMFAKK